MVENFKGIRGKELDRDRAVGSGKGNAAVSAFPTFTSRRVLFVISLVVAFPAPL